LVGGGSHRGSELLEGGGGSAEKRSGRDPSRLKMAKDKNGFSCYTALVAAKVGVYA
jgi:hypothetical protein